MKTEVIMKRPFMGGEISQKSKSEFLSATDLVRIGNKWRVQNEMYPFLMSDWLQQKNTKEFIEEIESIENCKVKISGKGRGKHTWVHPLLFMDMALAINPKFKVQVYKWLHDHLLKNRNISGDTYKLMSGSLYNHSKVKSKFHLEIRDVARQIKSNIGVIDWETATEEQLKLREDIHKAITLLSNVLKDNNQAVKLGIEQVLGEKQND